jgi:hypothetical protein
MANPEEEPTMSDVMEELKCLRGAVSDLGVEVQRMKLAIEKLTKLIEAIEGSVEARTGA